MRSSGPAHSVRAALACAAIAAVACGTLFGFAACSLSGANVTERSPTGALPISGEGRWHDLVSLAQSPSQPDLSHVFSRRWLLAVTAKDPGAYPTTPEEYALHLATMDAELEKHAVATGAFSARVRAALLAKLKGGTFYSSKPVAKGPRFTDDRSYPHGPNRSEMTVEYWPQGVGLGKPEKLTIRFVQEYEEWRIDGATPALFGDGGYAGEPEPMAPAAPATVPAAKPDANSTANSTAKPDAISTEAK